MDRRELLSAALRTTSAAAAVGLGGVSVAAEAVSDRYDALKERLDALEGNQRKAIRALLVVTSIGTGIDVVSLF